MTTSPPVLSLPDAERLAERTLAAIPFDCYLAEDGEPCDTCRHSAADRERVASDLAGLREHQSVGAGVLCACHTPGSSRVRHALGIGTEHECPDARRYSDNLRRTAALYGVTTPSPDRAPSADGLRHDGSTLEG